MTNCNIRFLISVLFALYFTNFGLAQDLFHVFIDQEILIGDQIQLREASRISALHERYPAEWIDNYTQTTISVSNEAMSFSAEGTEDILTEEQRAILRSAEVGSRIEIHAKYWPKNSLKHNTIKELSFGFLLVPTEGASFVGGEENRATYISNNITSKLSREQRDSFNIVRVEFTIDVNGKLIDPIVQMSSNDAEVDAIIVNGLKEMPRWLPAKDIHGDAVSQSLTFVISSIEGHCLTHGSYY